MQYKLITIAISKAVCFVRNANEIRNPAKNKLLFVSLNLNKNSPHRRKNIKRESAREISNHAPLILNVAANKPTENMPKTIELVSLLTNSNKITKQPNDAKIETNRRGKKPIPKN